MKLGISTYSLSRLIRTGDMSILDVLQWTADHGGEHVEIFPSGFDLNQNPELIEAIRRKAEETHIELSSYTVRANFLKESEAEYEQEIIRVKREVDIAQQLKVKRMRHDVAFRPAVEATFAHFDADLPRLVHACAEIADYAAQYDIVTSVENHGFYMQGSERMQRLIHAVNKPNFKATIDIGNFMCIDENPAAALKRNIAYASTIHLKDFYWRPCDRNPGEGWFRTQYGNYLRGAIVGQGDIPMHEIIREIKQSGYNGYISIEFEGMEECRKGTRIGLDNARRLWEEL